MKNYWNVRTVLSDGGERHYLASSNWECPYIIRLGKHQITIYDFRKYANMATIDYSYFGYSVVSSHKTQDAAKRKVAKLMRVQR